VGLRRSANSMLRHPGEVGPALAGQHPCLAKWCGLLPASAGIRQIPGGFEARIALLNDLSNRQRRSSRARGVNEGNGRTCHVVRKCDASLAVLRSPQRIRLESAPTRARSDTPMTTGSSRQRSGFGAMEPFFAVPRRRGAHAS
jgi:hypothetical protein